MPRKVQSAYHHCQFEVYDIDSHNTQTDVFFMQSKHTSNKHIMRARSCLFLAGFIVFLSLFGGLSAQTSPNVIRSAPISDGGGSWRSLYTPHFAVHFPKGREKYARKAAKLFERVHKQLAALYTKPWKKYTNHVTLVFSSDITQGFATTLGINQMVLYLEPPRLGTFSRYEEWLELLFVHEYTHILSLQIWDFDRQILFWFRLLFGIPPNFASPRSFVEGIAVWEESKWSGLGRQEDSLTQMTVRTAVREQAYPELGEILNSTNRWPLGAIPYLYGGRFMAELERQGGGKAPREYWGTNRLPMALDSRLRYFDTSVQKIYRAMRQRDFEHFGKEITELEKKGLTPYERLTFDGHIKSFLVPGKSGELLYYAAPPAAVSGVYSLATRGKTRKPRRIRHQLSNRGIAWAQGRRIYSADKTLYPSFGIRQELYDGNRSYIFSRMAPGRSISYPALSPDARHIFFIERSQGRRRLKSAELRKGRLQNENTLIETAYDGILQYTALSPDGSYLAVLYRPTAKGFAGLALCRLNGAQAQGCRVILRAKATLTQPCFSPDSTHLFFSSDADGIYDLYSYALGRVTQDTLSDTKIELDDYSSGKSTVKRLTHTTGGFFHPAAAADALYAVAYFKDGYDIVRIGYDKLSTEEVNFFTPGAPIPAPSEQEPASPLNEKDKALEPDKPRQETEQVQPDSAEKEDKREKEGFPEGSYRSLLHWRPHYTGLFDIGRSAPTFMYFGGGLEARDPLNWHILGGSFSALARQTPEEELQEEETPSLPAAFYYIYNRYKLGISLNHVRDQKHTKTNRAYLSYIQPGRFVSFQGLAGYESQENFGRVRTRNQRGDGSSSFGREWVLNGPSLVLLMGKTHSFKDSISPELGWRIVGHAAYYNKHNSKIKIHDENRSLTSEVPIEYGFGEGGVFLYLPSFFKNHVNYLSAYGYYYYGESADLRYHAQGNLVRNLDPAVFPGLVFRSFTYEYRFPLLWYSRPLVKRWPFIALRYLSLAPFYDYGIVENGNSTYDTWAYGLKLGIAMDFYYFSFPEFQISVSNGKNSETRYAFAFSTSLGLQSNTHRQKTGYSDAITQPYRHPLPQTKLRAGYFHSD